MSQLYTYLILDHNWRLVAPDVVFLFAIAAPRWSACTRLQFNRRGHDLGGVLGQAFRLMLVFDVGLDDDKLIAAEPGYDVIGADDVP